MSNAALDLPLKGLLSNRSAALLPSAVLSGCYRVCRHGLRFEPPSLRSSQPRKPSLLVPMEGSARAQARDLYSGSGIEVLEEEARKMLSSTKKSWKRLSRSEKT